MRSPLLTTVAAVASLAVPAASLNILLGNDDGFGSAQIRETYRLLKASGHNVVMVAPVDNESGQGGRVSSATGFYRIYLNLAFSSLASPARQRYTTPVNIT